MLVKGNNNKKMQSERKIPDDPYVEIKDPKGNIRPYYFFKMYNKYDHPLNNNEFGQFRSPITLKEYEAARADALTHFLELNQSVVCKEIQESLRQELHNAMSELNESINHVSTEIECLKQEQRNYSNTSNANYLKNIETQLKHWEYRFSELESKMNRVFRIKEHIASPKTNLKTLDEEVEQSLMNLDIEAPLIQNQVPETLKSSENETVMGYELGVKLPDSLLSEDAPKSIDSEVLKYYNCIHSSFYQLLILSTMVKCRRELAEFRVCHTRLLKRPNIREHRWNKYIKCLHNWNYYHYRYVTNQLHFWEKRGLWKIFARGIKVFKDED